MSDHQQPIIRINNISKLFGADIVAVSSVTLDIKRGEFFALLGPSGCGKTTLLRMLAGFETPSEGEIIIDSQNMASVQPEQRPVNMVFQSYAVFPHMSVFDNIAYGLKVSGTPRAEINDRVSEALDLVRLSDFARRQPDQLSGGQRQRVALARALVKKPKVLLLDEPLSALDAKLREAMQLELVKLQQAVGITFVIVTHDQDEALSMADRIAVMNQGEVCQIAAPRELYEYPSNKFVADFIGKMNLFTAVATGSDGSSTVVTIEGFGDIVLPLHISAADPSIAIRPEKIRIYQKKPQSKDPYFLSTVRNVSYHGSESHVFLTNERGREFTATVQNDRRQSHPLESGDQVWAGWATDDTLVLEN